MDTPQVRGALMSVPGVVSAKVNCGAGRALVKATPGTDPEDIAAAVSDIGFDTEVLDSTGP